MRGRLAAVSLSLLLVAAAAQAAAAVPGPPSLSEAAARLAAVSGPDEYAATLDELSTRLPPAQALELLDKNLDSLKPEFRKALSVKAGDLSLLLGLFAAAASRYEAAATLVPEAPDGPLLLRAARACLAAGDHEGAARIASELMIAAGDAELAASARLVGAWALALQGRSAEARAIAAALPGREARFVVWLCSVSGSAASDKAAAAAAAAALAADYPGSPEAQIASGAAFPPPLPHWYLGALGGALPAAAPAPSGPAAPPKPAPAPAAASPAPGAAPAPPPSASSAATASATASAAASTARSRRLQVGYFSSEARAVALRDELASKRFAAAVEPRTRSGGAGKPDERRWIVVVEGGKDIARTMQSLKDSGYESYIID